MGTAKTRNILIDVARELFATQGVESTTMNDIAVAAKKGRRTLYTYFQNKEDVYSAVVETELFQLAHKLQEEMHKDMGPADRLINYIYVRMNLFQETVNRNGNLQASFFSNIHLVEKVRHKLDIREKRMIEDIIVEGNEMGVFHVKYPRLAATIIHCSLKGCEVPFIRGELRMFLKAESRKAFATFLLSGLAESIELK